MSWVSSLKNSPNTQAPQTHMLLCTSGYVADSSAGYRKSEVDLMSPTSKTSFCDESNNGIIKNIISTLIIKYQFINTKNLAFCYDL